MQRIISLICLKLTWTALHCIFSVSAWCHGPDPVCQNVSPTSLFRNCWKAPQHNTEMHVFCFLWWMNESFSLVESGPPWFIEINKGCLCSWTLIWKLAPCFWNLQQFSTCQVWTKSCFNILPAALKMFWLVWQSQQCWCSKIVSNPQILRYPGKHQQQEGLKWWTWSLQSGDVTTLFGAAVFSIVCLRLSLSHCDAGKHQPWHTGKNAQNQGKPRQDVSRKRNVGSLTTCSNRMEAKNMHMHAGAHCF